MAFQSNFLERIPPVTRSLLIVNVIMFVATLINENFMVGTFAMFYPTSPFFRWWQPLTHMFMHGGWWHILFNMYTLVMFGMVVERALGTKKFLILYFVTGLGAVALHTGVEWLQVGRLVSSVDGGFVLSETDADLQAYSDLVRTPMVGASGAIYGVLVAFAMLYPEARMTLIFPPVTLDAKWMVAIFIGLELLTGITGSQVGIAHFAHLGGALFGFLLVWYWRKRGELWRR
ncbi:MAG: rhomboid family intramembrane serine protease [Bacteroidales bacterium]|nr:rhomboid family intramembrane serine protease [Bacteroidales bacterium]